MDPKEQATKVKEWIDSHWRGRGRCPRCGEGNWTVKYVVSLPLTAVPAALAQEGLNPHRLLSPPSPKPKPKNLFAPMPVNATPMAKSG